MQTITHDDARKSLETGQFTTVLVDYIRQQEAICKEQLKILDTALLRSNYPATIRCDVCRGKLKSK